MATYNWYANAPGVWGIDTVPGGSSDATLTTQSSGQLVYTSSDGTKSLISGTGLSVGGTGGISWTTLTSVVHVSADGATTYESITGFSLGAGGVSGISSLLQTVLAGNDTFNLSGNTYQFFDFGGNNTVNLGPAANRLDVGNTGTNIFIVGAGDWVSGNSGTSLSGGGAEAGTLQLSSVGTIDISGNDLTAVQTLQFLSGTNTATVATGQLSKINGSSGVDTLNLVYTGATTNLSAMKFQNWTSGQDVINISITANYGDWVTTSQDDTITITADGRGNINTGAGNDTVIFVNNNNSGVSLTGSSGNDVIQLNSSAVDFSGQASTSGHGFKTVTYSSGTSSLSVSAAQLAAGAFQVYNGSANVDTLIVKGPGANLSGLTFNNWSANDIIQITSSGSGATALVGSSQNDIFYMDNNSNTVDGGGGTNTVDYSAIGSVSIAISDAGNITVTKYFGGVDTLTHIQKLIGSQGFDTVSFAGLTTTGISANMNGGTLTISAGANQYSFVSVENIVGTSHNDVIYAGGGQHVIDGGAGFDVEGYNLSYGSCTFFRDLGGQWMVFSDAADTLIHIEEIQFSDRVFLLTQYTQNDVNYDGASDVLFRSAANNQLLARDALNQSWIVVTGGLNSDYVPVGVGDTDNNGYADAFIQQQSTGTVFTELRNASGFTGWAQATPGLNSQWKAVAVADMNNDGTTDVVIQNTASGTIYVAFDQQGGFFNNWGVVSSSLTSDWQVKGVGDVKGTGYNDVVIQSQSTGVVYYGDMTGGSFKGWGVVTTNIGTDWQVKGVADLNGDGYADVIIQNTNNGTTYYANMAGGTFHDWVFITNSLPSDYVVKEVGDLFHKGHMDVVFQQTSTGATIYADMIYGTFHGWGAVSYSGTGYLVV